MNVPCSGGLRELETPQDFKRFWRGDRWGEGGVFWGDDEEVEVTEDDEVMREEVDVSVTISVIEIVLVIRAVSSLAGRAKVVVGVASRRVLPPEQ